MPAKIAHIRSYGAELVVEGEGYADALALSEASAAESGALTPPQQPRLVPRPLPRLAVSHAA